MNPDGTVEGREGLTPGPWRLIPGRASRHWRSTNWRGPRDWNIEAGPEDFPSLVAIVRGSAPTGRRGMANARLIARAWALPALLQAARVALEALDRAPWSKGASEAREYYPRRLLLAAIRAAEGREEKGR